MGCDGLEMRGVGAAGVHLSPSKYPPPPPGSALVPSRLASIASLVNPKGRARLFEVANVYLSTPYMFILTAN